MKTNVQPLYPNRFAGITLKSLTKQERETLFGLGCQVIAQEANALSKSERDRMVAATLRVLKHEHKRGRTITDPGAMKEYLVVLAGGLPHEEFGVTFLDNKHRVIRSEQLFRGTIDGASVHPRVVLQRGLEVNAAAVVLHHNHPSGVVDPSTADQRITQRLKETLSLVDIKVLDHIIVGAERSFSFAEAGML